MTEWFNNLKVTYKLTFSFSIVAVLVAIVGYLGWSDINLIKERSDLMYEKHLLGIRYLTHIAEAYPFTLVKTRDIILAANDIAQDTYRKEIFQLEGDIDEWSEELEKTMIEDEEKRVFEVYKNTMIEFRETRNELLLLASEDGKKDLATRMLYHELQSKADKLKKVIDKLIVLKEKLAASAQELNRTTAYEAIGTLLKLAILALALTVVIGVFVYYSISLPISQLENRSSRIAKGDLDAKMKTTRKDEIGLMIRSFNSLVDSLDKMVLYADKIAAGDYASHVEPRSDKDKLAQALNSMSDSLRDQSWLNNSMNQLNTLLSGHFTLKEIAERTVSFLGRTLEAGAGALFIYDDKKHKLKLLSTFAYVERDALSAEFDIGEGVVGQVGFEKKPIILKNIKEKRAITTGTLSRNALNTFTFPLLYENELCGVIELASFEPFNSLKQSFIDEAAQLIASHIYSALQSDRISILLADTRKAQENATQKAAEVEKANEALLEQQKVLQKQSEELQQQTEEMMQQSEELQQTNEELQQQQELLEKQSRELHTRNQDLNVTKADLENKAAELERASKYKSEFLANMSHELRTPLNSIILLSDMLRRNSKNEKDSQKAGIIYQSGNDLLTLINDILDISKIEAGKMTINIHHFHSKELKEELFLLFEELAKQKKLKYEAIDEIGNELVNDKEKIKQVLKNFLSNAFKFTKNGGVTLKIAPSGVKNLPVKISVIDTGIGIPEEKQQIIFEAFQQADGSVSREFGGTGLGLSIAREMARMLGGEVGLESKTGAGSTFFLLLPDRNTLIEKSNNAKNIEVLYEPKKGLTEQAEEKVRRAVHAYQPRTNQLEIEDDRNNILPNDRIILIVEDNIDYANSLAEISRSVGFKTVIANSGNLALELVRKFNPVGVLLDLGLPDISGEQVLKELKSTLELRHIPVSIVSARDKNRNLLEMGAVGYLQKPVEARSIRETVVRLGEISGKYPKNMLIVEDHPGQRRAVMELLSSEGIVCTGVDCEEDAVFELKKGDFDAVIVDMGLRQGNGLNVCRYISDQKMHIPVLIYTGKELTEAERNELKLYSVSILPKGSSPNVLLDKAQLFLHKVYNHSLDAQDGIKPEASGLLDELENLIGVALQNEYKRDDEEYLTKQEIAENNIPVGEKTAQAEQNTETDNSEEEVSAGQVVNAALEAILADESEAASSGVDLKGKRILIVDDDVRNVFVITSALENHNAQIFESFNGKEAIDFLKDGNDVDLILMDIMMPVMDGYECMREIRASEKYKNLPIIAVTAKALKGDKQKCLDAGANDYMTKPIDYKVLLALVEQYICK